MLSRFTFCVPTLYLLRFARVKRAQVGSTLLSRWFHEEIAVYGGVSVVHKEKRWAFCENRSLFWPKRSAFFCRNSCLAGVYSCLADSWSWWRLSGSKVKGLGCPFTARKLMHRAFDPIRETWRLFLRVGSADPLFACLTLKPWQLGQRTAHFLCCYS